MTHKLANLPLTLATLTLALALAPANARAQSTAPAPAPLTVEQRLAKLEAASAASAASPASPASNPLAVKPGASEQYISIGGFIQGQAEFGDALDTRFTSSTPPASNNRIYLRRARIILGGKFAENFEFKLAAEMSNGGYAGSTAMRGQLIDGYLTWTKYPFLNITAGQFKTPFGYEFLLADSAGPVIEHTFVTDALMAARQDGIGANGAFLDSRLTYSVGVYNGNGMNNNVNDNKEFLYAARVAFAPVKTKIASLDWNIRWSIGANAYRSNDATLALPGGVTAPKPGFGRRTGWAADTQLILGPMAFNFEYISTDYVFTRTVPTATKLTAAGWYLQAVYDLTKKWQAAIRYDTFNPDTSLDNSATNTWTLGVNWRLKGDDLKFMLEYLMGDPSFNAGANIFQSTGRANRVMMRVQTIF